MSRKTKYATIGWTPQDILDNVNGECVCDDPEKCTCEPQSDWWEESLGWTAEQAEKFLAENELEIIHAMIEGAGDYIREQAWREVHENVDEDVAEDVLENE